MKKQSELVAQLQLPEGKSARLRKGQIVIVSVSPKKEIKKVTIKPSCQPCQMNIEFDFNGIRVSGYTNGKVYRNIQYVTLRHGYHKTEARWDHENSNWGKRCGNNEYDQVVAEAMGFVGVEVA